MVPSVSVLLPARNAERTLTEAMESLRRQTHLDWECILVDDASSDRTGKIAGEISAEDPRFRLYRRPETGGIIPALNQAAREARAPYLARQDADDVSSPARLEQTLALLESSPRLGAVGCRVRLFPEENVRPGWRAYGEWLNGLVAPEEIAREIYVESPLPHPSVIMRRQAFEDCGGYQDRGWPEDYDLWLRMHTAGWQFAKPPEILYAWRHHEGRLTHEDPRYDPAAFLACKLHHLAPCLEERAVLIWGAGRNGLRLGRALRERGLRPTAFVDIDPRKIGGDRQGCPILSPQDLGSRSDWPRGPQEDPPLILVAVGTKGARQLIRKRLLGAGWTEGVGFICLH